VRQGAREGTLLDVATDPIFIALLLRNLRQSLTVQENGLRLKFLPTARFADRQVRQPEHIQPIETERPFSTALVDSDYVVKLYRRLETGPHPAIEMGRFLTDVAGFANAPALLGSVELVEDERRTAIATVHAFVANQGDGWTVSAAYLDRFIDAHRLLAGSGHPGESDEQVLYLRYMSQAGRRIAELHLALASSAEDAAFVPEPAGPEDLQRWVSALSARAARVFDILSERRDAVAAAERPPVDRMLAVRATWDEHLNTLLTPDIDNLSIRQHGDLRLGHLLIVKDDIFITGFDGEVGKSLAERRRKAPAARDVAALIRSIDYSVASALDRAMKMAPDELGNRLATALAEWRDRAIATFLSGYREVMADGRLWPSDPHAAGAMLDFFLLEKIISEIEDELAHRGEWLRVPLGAMLRILSVPASVN
jgi:maltose alpha-D-glucosyltransferase/alpha-amylase